MKYLFLIFFIFNFCIAQVRQISPNDNQIGNWLNNVNFFQANKAIKTFYRNFIGDISLRINNEDFKGEIIGASFCFPIDQGLSFEFTYATSYRDINIQGNYRLENLTNYSLLYQLSVNNIFILLLRYGRDNIKFHKLNSENIIEASTEDNDNNLGYGIMIRINNAFSFSYEKRDTVFGGKIDFISLDLHF